jgi:hypothetical protein
MSVDLDLNLLRTFTAVIETGGFTRAADRVRLTQSTVSLQIKKLESHFHGGVEKTWAGEGIVGG